MSHPSISTENLRTMKLLYSLTKEQKPREIRALLNLFKNELKDVRVDPSPFKGNISFKSSALPKKYVNFVSQRVQYTHLECVINTDNEKEFYIPEGSSLSRIGINVNINSLNDLPEDYSFTSDEHGLCLFGSTLCLLPLANETYVIRNSRLFYSKNKKYIYLHKECDKPIFLYSIPV